MDRKDQVSRFLKKNLIQESELLLSNGHVTSFFIHVAQGVELLGAFADNKPLRSRDQARKRFDKGLEMFFPPPYNSLNSGSGLYFNFRIHLIHTLLPSSRLIFTRRVDGFKHLSIVNKKLVFVAEDLLVDYQNAVLKLLDLIMNDDIKPKVMEGM